MERRIEAELRRVDREGRQWVRDRYPLVYQLGAESSAPFRWTLIHRQAVKILAEELEFDLLQATRHVRITAKRLIRRVAKDETLRKMLLGQDTAVGAARRMQRILNRDGIYAVRYRNGAKHGLREYAEMAVRTKTAQAYNHGTLNNTVAKFVEVFDGPNCGWTFHNDPDRAMGKIVSRAEAYKYSIAHPNCRRSFGPRPDVNNAREARRARSSRV